MNKFHLLGLLAIAWATPQASAQDAICPALPAGSNLHWQQQAGNGFTVCRALDGERQVIGVMLTSSPTVNLQRRNREEEGSIGAYEVHWYQPEIAVSTGERKRVTIVELGDDRYAQVWVDAATDAELRQLLSLPEAIALN